MPYKKVAWLHSLGFKGTAALVCIAGGLLLGALWVVNTTGKKQVLEESSKLIEQTGDNAVEILSGRSAEIASLVRTIATLTSLLPKDEKIYLETFPEIYDFNGDNQVAGGGIWPEPNQFKKDVIRRSFFWGRGPNGTFKYYDDYNDPGGKGYHNEEWYVVVRHTGPGRCFWSKSYMDPYSFQPMTTCTVGTFEKGQLTGTVTVDLKLEGIEESMLELQKLTGGYAVLLDRNGKFIAFPKAGKSAKTITTDDNGNRSEEFLTVNEFASKQPLFQPLANVVSKMNRTILEDARKSHDYSASLAEKIDAASYQINREEAEFITAVILDPLKDRTRKTKLLKTFAMENDLVLGQPSLGYLFHVPKSYWKLVIVKPLHEITATATRLVEPMIFKLGILILILTGMGYFLLRHYLVRPILQVAQSVKHVETLMVGGRISELTNQKLETHSNDEIGVVSQFFETLSRSFASSQEVIEEQKEKLEKIVEERSKKVEEVGFELRKSRRFLDNLVSNLPGMIYSCKNDENWTLVYVNFQCYTLTGYSAQKFLNQEVLFGKDVIHQDDQERVWREVQKALAEKKPYQITYRILTASEELKWVWEQGLGIYSSSGELDSLEGFIIDITRQKDSEKKLEFYALELQRSNKDLEDFAHLASHDLQEPLRKIVTFGNRLKDQSSKMGEKARDYLERMQNAAERMKNYIDDLLEYSRVTSIPRPYKLADLGKLTKQVLEDLDLQIKNNNATIQVDTLPTLELDSIQISKVLQNLISNAIKYHRPDVPPVVNLTSSYDEREKTWNIEVSDNGIGINEKYFERIFKPFERLHGRGTYAGTGIGLAICHKVVQRHKGKVSVRSTLQKGTTFIITLPESQTD